MDPSLKLPAQKAKQLVGTALLIFWGDRPPLRQCSGIVTLTFVSCRCHSK